MGEALILDTAFLIDLQREFIRQENGPAQRFLEQRPESSLYLAATVLGELACGASMASRERWEAFAQPFQVLPTSTDVCWEYGKAFRYLQANGLLIGSNDLWIAATAIAFGHPLVSRNERHFRRVPGLELRSY